MTGLIIWTSRWKTKVATWKGANNQGVCNHNAKKPLSSHFQNYLSVNAHIQNSPC